MKNPTFRRAALALLGGSFGVLATLPHLALAERKGDKAEVAVNCELTEEGRKVPRPTPQTPAYYVPVIFGYHENGRIIGGEEPPKREELIRHLALGLAKEGYVIQALRPDANTTMPELIITIEWGYLNPVVSQHGALDLSTGEGGTMSSPALRNDPTQAASTDMNQNEMITLVAGAAIRRQAQFTESDWAKLRDAVSDDRYFITLNAYDFSSSLKGEQKLLWTARMSTPRQGVWMNDIVPALITAGASVFGRQTDVPRWADFPLRDGKVILGELKVIETDVKVPAEKKP